MGLLDQASPASRRRGISFLASPIRGHAFFEQTQFERLFGHNFFEILCLAPQILDLAVGCCPALYLPPAAFYRPPGIPWTKRNKGSRQSLHDGTARQCSTRHATRPEPDFLLSRMALARCPAVVLHKLLRRGFSAYGFLSCPIESWLPCNTEATARNTKYAGPWWSPWTADECDRPRLFFRPERIHGLRARLTRQGREKLMQITISIDISKDMLDISRLSDNQHIQVTNDKAGHKLCFVGLKIMKSRWSYSRRPMHIIVSLKHALPWWRAALRCAERRAMGARLRPCARHCVHQTEVRFVGYALASDPALNVRGVTRFSS
jgi:hypothetical protein